MPNPEANEVAVRVRVYLGDVYTMHVYCFDAAVDHTHYRSETR